MNQGKIITKWDGLLPIVEEIPNHESIWDRIQCFMDIVRDIGAKDKVEGASIEV
jgi:hypothetical protein